MHDHHHHEHGDAHHIDFDSPPMADYAEREAEVLVDLLTEAISVLADRCARDGVDVRRVLDLGCGPGVGTCCLAERFGAANVVAVDGSAVMLERAAARAARLGLSARVDTRLVAFPAGLATLDPADVVWASLVIHHVGDEVDALRQIRGLLAPDGLLAIVERADPLRVLPDEVELGRPGIWGRLDAAWAAWFAEMRAELPGSTTSADYAEMLAAAGFAVLDDEVLRVVVGAPLDDSARRFARDRLARTRGQFGAHADAADLDALDVLLDEHSADGIMRRDDAQLRASRHLYLARPTTPR